MFIIINTGIDNSSYNTTQTCFADNDVRLELEVDLKTSDIIIAIAMHLTGYGHF